MINGLLFDKDGVLFDFQASWGVWAHGRIVHFSKGDKAVQQRLAQRLAFDFENRRFHPDSFVIAGAAMDVSRAFAEEVPGWSLSEVHHNLVESSKDAPMVTPVPLRPLFQQFRSMGLKIGLATNDIEDAARAQLDAEKVLDLFDFVSGSDSGYGPKPEPGMCLAFSQQTGLPVSQCAMIGDSTHDMHAGRAAGMRCVGVLTGVATRDDLSPYADDVLASIDALPGWLPTVHHWFEAQTPNATYGVAFC